MTTTKTNIALAELAEKGADADLLKQIIQYVAQRMMEMDAENLCAASYGERSPERLNSRNGYRERLWDARAGSVDLKIPKLRKGSYFPAFHEPIADQHRWYASVLRGHYAYYGLPHNYRALAGFRRQLLRIWLLCLRRRSQRSRRAGFDWFNAVTRMFPLPRVHITRSWADQRV